MRRTEHASSGTRRERSGASGAPRRGSALVPVMAIVAAVLLIGTAIFILGHSEGDIVENAVDDSRAFYIAEGGLERMRGWLGDYTASEPNGDPLGKKLENEPLGGGAYTVEIVEDVGGGGWLGAYKVVSTGEIDGVVRQVRAQMIAETFARYQVFVERGGWVWFLSGERFEGPVHVNFSLQIDGDPWFGSEVRAGGGLTEKPGSNPVFEQGYELNVPTIPLPADSYPMDTIKPAAESGGLALPMLSGNDAEYEIDLDYHGPGLLAYRGYEGGTWSAWSAQQDISALNGAIYSPEPLRLSGVLDGQVTIGVEGNVYVIDDILYDGVTPGSTPPSDCDDVLGIIADGDFVIAYEPPNYNDCMFYGVAMALEKNIEAEDYMHHAPRGAVEMYGGIIADYSIHLGQYDNNGNLISGYTRDFNWDARMLTMPPPFFPLTGRYLILSWEEVVPPEV